MGEKKPVVLKIIEPEAANARRLDQFSDRFAG